jgi:RNA polymerase sigma factor (sigma-70 family)
MGESLTHTNHVAGESEGSFAEVYQQYQDRIRRISFGCTGCWHLSEDVVQEVMMNCWIHWTRLKNEVRNLESYITVATRHSSYRILAKQRRALKGYNRYFAEHRTLMEEIESKLHYKEVRSKLVAKLPLRQQQVFEMTMEHGWNYRDIAKVLKISPSTVKQHRAKAFEKVIEMLKVA